MRINKVMLAKFISTLSASFWLPRFLGWLAIKILRRPFLLIFLTLLGAGVSLYYSVTHLNINTSTTDLVSPDAPFNQNWRQFEKLFPQDNGAIVVVVESSTPELTNDAVKRLNERLKADKNHFLSVYMADEGDFFEKNGLVYLKLDELESLSVQLSKAQPFLGRLTENNNVEELFSILGQALTVSENDFPIELSPVMDKIRVTTAALLAGRNEQLSWQQLMLQEQLGFLNPTQRFLMIKPKLDTSKVMPGAEAIEAIRQAAEVIQDKNLPVITVRISGEPALEFDELTGVSQGIEIATVFSVITVAIILFVAYRSLKLVLATLAAITIAMFFSAGFATLAIGQLNLISIAYAVSSVGLGVEYAIHFCLRFGDDLKQRIGSARALISTLTSVSPSLILSASSTAIGLYAFIPTDYKGVSQLGILAGSSLFICLIIVLTFLPALLIAFPIKAAHLSKINRSFSLPDWMRALPFRHARVIRYATIILIVLAVAQLPKVTIDFNPINLRDPDSESVQTFHSLLKNKDATPMIITVLSTNPKDTIALQSRLESLPSVAKTVSLFSFIPDQQTEKLARIEELGLLLGPSLTHFPALATPKNPEAAIEGLLKALNQTIQQKPQAPDTKSSILLQAELNHLLNELNSLAEPMKQAFIDKLQAGLLGSLPVTLKYLQAGLQPSPITIDSLPGQLKDRWVSQNGHYRIQVFPRNDLNQLDNLKQFITEVQSIAPDATDLPILYFESMKEVVKAFKQAMLIALGAITLLLVLVRQSVVETALILLPLLLGGLFTVVAMVLTDTPFNFANIIVLPLLLGMGVENGIHMVERLRHEETEDDKLFGSSHLRGIFYGGLTSLIGFMGLIFSPHRGIASIGIVIVMGIILIMLNTFVILPAFSQCRRKGAQL